MKAYFEVQSARGERVDGYLRVGADATFGGCRFSERVTAIEHAKGCAKANPGIRFVVLHGIATACMETVTTEELS